MTGSSFGMPHRQEFMVVISRTACGDEHRHGERTPSVTVQPVEFSLSASSTSVGTIRHLPLVTGTCRRMTM